MNPTTNTAQEDLAFLRSIVDEMAPGYRKMGIVYMWAGILYGLQCFANYALLVGLVPQSGLAWMTVGWLPTIIFLVINFVSVWRDRAAPFGRGVARKAINAAFAGAGVANLILAIIFGVVAYGKNDWSIWFLFPVVVCAGQGAVWFTVTVLRRQLWTTLTSVGWFLATIILALVLPNTNLYILTLGVALLLCMAVPGYIMTRSTEAS